MKGQGSSSHSVSHSLFTTLRQTEAGTQPEVWVFTQAERAKLECDEQSTSSQHPEQEAFHMFSPLFTCVLRINKHEVDTKFINLRT